MKTEAQLAASIERFQHVFWDKQPGARPPVGVVNQGIYLPIQYLRQPFLRDEVEPADVRPERLMTDYEFGMANRPVNGDDWIPFAAPWRGIPWLEACCGCPVKFSTGSLAPEPGAASLEALDQLMPPVRLDWRDCLRRETERLVRTAPPDCWISPSILRGPSDVLAALRGLTEFMCDLHDAPELLARAAGRINRMFLDVLDEHFARVPPKRGGYGHIFGYWAPGPTIAIQEDALGLCRPALYRDLFFPHNVEIVKHLGAHVLFHLHSTGFQHWRDVLNVPGLAGLQMVIEANGPPLSALVPVFREILERSRLVVFVDNRFEELPGVLSQLPTAGLYVVVPEAHVRTEAEFQQFIAAHWKRD